MIGEAFIFAKCFEQFVHFVSVFLLHGQDLFHQDTAGGIVVAERTNDLAIGFDRNQLRHQVFPDHVQQRIAFGILRTAAGGQAIRIEVWCSAQLRDPSSNQIGMTLFLARMLRQILEMRDCANPYFGSRDACGASLRASAGARSRSPPRATLRTMSSGRTVGCAESEGYCEHL